jgi:hypothetical protein
VTFGEASELKCFYTQDQPWSYSEVMQIIGRVWRKGQKDLVFVYRLIACDTADETMSGYANGKALMLEQLTTQRQLLDGIHGRDEATLAELDDEQPTAPTKTGRRKKASNVKPRALKSSRIINESDSEDQEPQSTSTQPASKAKTNLSLGGTSNRQGRVKGNKPKDGSGKVTGSSFAEAKGKAKAKDLDNTPPPTPIPDTGSSSCAPCIDPMPTVDRPPLLEQSQATDPPVPSSGISPPVLAPESNKLSQLQGSICF